MPLRLIGSGVTLAVAAFSALLLPQHVHGTDPAPSAAADVAELWVDPGDYTARNLFYGAGGEALVPKPGTAFHFVAEDKKGFSPGWDVKDDAGIEWSVKYGPEAQSEVVASRLLWAMGYHQPPMYYVEQWSLADGPAPGIKTPGRFRPSLPGRSRVGRWSWEHNPFVDRQEYRGLLVLMRILNNWDLLEQNTAIYDLAEPLEGTRRWYVVIDLGASLGRTTIFPHSGTRNDVQDFEKQGYIGGVKDGRVRFDDLGRRHRGLFDALTPADVRWISERLARLTPEQWNDTFRAARYTDEESQRFQRRIKEKIAVGLALKG